MLSGEQRRELIAIEQRLTAEDPDLARMLQEGLPPVGGGVPARILLGAVGLLAVLAGATGLGAVLVALGILTLVVSAAMPPFSVSLRPRRRRGTA